MNNKPTFRHQLKTVESNVLDFLSAVTPWLSPLIAAYFNYTNTMTQFHWPVWMGLVSAASAEFLGLVAIHTTFQFWSYNDERDARLWAVMRGKKKLRRPSSGRAKTWLAASAGAFYLVLVITVNILLDIGSSTPTVILAKTLLSLVSVVSAVTLALRSQHSRRLLEAEDRTQRLRETLASKRKEQAAPPPAVVTNLADSVRALVGANPNLANRPSEVASQLGIPVGTAKSALFRLRKASNGHETTEG